MDIEEARRRLAAHPRHGDPTAQAGETLQEKAERLRAEQGLADDRVRVTAQPDGTAMVWLPYVDYLDTQAGPVEVGLDEDVAMQLWLALGRHLASSESEEFEVVGDWGVDGAEDAGDARAQVAKWLAAHPRSGAHAQRRTVLTFEDDDAQYTGGWQPLDASPARLV